MNSKIIAEYIWIGGNGELRSKARTLNKQEYIVDTLPNWNFDGSSTCQAHGENSEIIIIPRSIFWCPFRLGDNILVMCDTYYSDGKPLPNNYRHPANELFNKNLKSEPWFGIEQEFFLINNDTGYPLGYNKKISNKQGQYYCGVGSNNVFGRELIDEHYAYCLNSGINISGVNAEVATGQWEYQVGPCEGIQAGDQLWVSRYILSRLAERYNIIIDYEPNPLKGDWNSSGCHTNYSTRQTREGTSDKTGLMIIGEAIDKLSKKHKEHMKIYGSGNEERMSGLHETSKFNEFSYGVGDRKASIRIPTTTVENRCGYFEDRRPSSNMDPYQVTGILFKTTVLD
jgi:glutamine synthetase